MVKDAVGALDGIRVLDFANPMGVYCTKLLADYGAEVIKVERPGGDPFRGDQGFVVWNRSKKGITLDLKKEEGQKVAQELGYECIARETLLEASKEFHIPYHVKRRALKRFGFRHIARDVIGNPAAAVGYLFILIQENHFRIGQYSLQTAGRLRSRGHAANNNNFHSHNKPQ